MGRMHTPTAILDARGAFIHHPERKRPNEPVVTEPLGGPPKHLTPDQKKLWKEFVRMCPAGVVKYSDRWSVERIVLLMDRQRKDTIKIAEASQLDHLLARFGMTPSDRARVSVEQPKESRLAKFLKQPKPTGPRPPLPTFDPAAPVN